MSINMNGNNQFIQLIYLRSEIYFVQLLSSVPNEINRMGYISEIFFSEQAIFLQN